jgi:hypothetical protein
MAGIEMAGKRELPFYLSIDIPEELGTVEALYEAPSGANSQFILHIQNAHANYQAQIKIKQLLQHMNKNYGFKTIFVEGATEKLDPDQLRLFRDQERNLKLCDELAKQGELTGAELFLMEQTAGLGTRDSGSAKTRNQDGSQGAGNESRAEDRKVEALGIEQALLYRSNYEALKKVFGAEADVTRFFKGFDGKLDKVASKTFTPETRALIADWQRFEQGRRDFMPFVKGLAAKSKKILKVDLESLFAQVGWPQISRLLVIQQMEKEMNRAKAIEEQASLIKMLRAKGISKKLIATIENFNEGNIAMGKSSSEVSPREVLERLAAEAGPKGFKFSDYPAFSLFAGYVILRSELDGKVLFEEIEYLFTQMLDTLTEEPQQKALLALYRDGELLRKLLHLELSRTQWQEVVNAGDRMTVPSLVARLKEVVRESTGDSGLGTRSGTGVTDSKKRGTDTSFEGRATSPLPSAATLGDVMPKAFEKTMDEVFTAGLEFYDYAHKRESVFYKEMQTAMTERKITKAILITGGFHTDGMSDLFRENAVSYGIVTPRLSEKSNESLYRKIMLQDEKVPFSLSYLEVAPHLADLVTIENQGLVPVDSLKGILKVFISVGNFGSLNAAAIAAFNSITTGPTYKGVKVTLELKENNMVKVNVAPSAKAQAAKRSEVRASVALNLANVRTVDGLRSELENAGTADVTFNHYSARATAVLELLNLSEEAGALTQGEVGDLLKRAHDDGLVVSTAKEIIAKLPISLSTEKYFDQFDSFETLRWNSRALIEKLKGQVPSEKELGKQAMPIAIALAVASVPLMLVAFWGDFFYIPSVATGVQGILVLALASGVLSGYSFWRAKLLANEAAQLELLPQRLDLLQKLARKKVSLATLDVMIWNANLWLGKQRIRNTASLLSMPELPVFSASDQDVLNKDEKEIVPILLLPKTVLSDARELIRKDGTKAEGLFDLEYEGPTSVYGLDLRPALPASRIVSQIANQIILETANIERLLSSDSDNINESVKESLERVQKWVKSGATAGDVEAKAIREASRDLKEMLSEKLSRASIKLAGLGESGENASQRISVGVDYSKIGVQLGVLAKTGLGPELDRGFSFLSEMFQKRSDETNRKDPMEILGMARGIISNLPISAEFKSVLGQGEYPRLQSIIQRASVLVEPIVRDIRQKQGIATRFLIGAIALVGGCFLLSFSAFFGGILGAPIVIGGVAVTATLALTSGILAWRFFAATNILGREARELTLQLRQRFEVLQALEETGISFEELNRLILNAHLGGSESQEMANIVSLLSLPEVARFENFTQSVSNPDQTVPVLVLPKGLLIRSPNATGLILRNGEMAPALRNYNNQGLLSNYALDLRQALPVSKGPLSSADQANVEWNDRQGNKVSVPRDVVLLVMNRIEKLLSLGELEVVENPSHTYWYTPGEETGSPLLLGDMGILNDFGEGSEAGEVLKRVVSVAQDLESKKRSVFLRDPVTGAMLASAPLKLVAQESDAFKKSKEAFIKSIRSEARSNDEIAAEVLGQLPWLTQVPSFSKKGFKFAVQMLNEDTPGRGWDDIKEMIVGRLEAEKDALLAGRMTEMTVLLRVGARSSEEITAEIFGRLINDALSTLAWKRGKTKVAAFDVEETFANMFDSLFTIYNNVFEQVTDKAEAIEKTRNSFVWGTWGGALGFAGTFTVSLVLGWAGVPVIVAAVLFAAATVVSLYYNLTFKSEQKDLLASFDRFGEMIDLTANDFLHLVSLSSERGGLDAISSSLSQTVGKSLETLFEEGARFHRNLPVLHLTKQQVEELKDKLSKNGKLPSRFVSILADKIFPMEGRDAGVLLPTADNRGLTGYGLDFSNGSRSDSPVKQDESVPRIARAEARSITRTDLLRAGARVALGVVLLGSPSMGAGEAPAYFKNGVNLLNVSTGEKGTLETHELTGRLKDGTGIKGNEIYLIPSNVPETNPLKSAPMAPGDLILCIKYQNTSGGEDLLYVELPIMGLPVGRLEAQLKDFLTRELTDLDRRTQAAQKSKAAAADYSKIIGFDVFYSPAAHRKTPATQKEFTDAFKKVFPSVLSGITNQDSKIHAGMMGDVQIVPANNRVSVFSDDGKKIQIKVQPPRSEVRGFGVALEDVLNDNLNNALKNRILTALRAKNVPEWKNAIAAVMAFYYAKLTPAEKVAVKQNRSFQDTMGSLITAIVGVPDPFTVKRLKALKSLGDQLTVAEPHFPSLRTVLMPSSIDKFSVLLALTVNPGGLYKDELDAVGVQRFVNDVREKERIAAQPRAEVRAEKVVGVNLPDRLNLPNGVSLVLNGDRPRGGVEQVGGLYDIEYEGKKVGTLGLNFRVELKMRAAALAQAGSIDALDGYNYELTDYSLKTDRAIGDNARRAVVDWFNGRKEKSFFLRFERRPGSVREPAIKRAPIARAEVREAVRSPAEIYAAQITEVLEKMPVELESLRLDRAGLDLAMVQGSLNDLMRSLDFGFKDRSTGDILQKLRTISSVMSVDSKISKLQAEGTPRPTFSFEGENLIVTYPDDLGEVEISGLRNIDISNGQFQVTHWDSVTKAYRINDPLPLKLSEPILHRMTYPEFRAMKAVQAVAETFSPEVQRTLEKTSFNALRAMNVFPDELIAVSPKLLVALALARGFVAPGNLEAVAPLLIQIARFVDANTLDGLRDALQKADLGTAIPFSAERGNYVEVVDAPTIMADQKAQDAFVDMLKLNFLLNPNVRQRVIVLGDDPRAQQLAADAITGNVKEWLAAKNQAMLSERMGILVVDPKSPKAKDLVDRFVKDIQKEGYIVSGSQKIFSQHGDIFSSLTAVAPQVYEGDDVQSGIIRMAVINQLAKAGQAIHGTKGLKAAAQTLKDQLKDLGIQADGQKFVINATSLGGLVKTLGTLLEAFKKISAAA